MCCLLPKEALTIRAEEIEGEANCQEKLLSRRE